MFLSRIAGNDAEDIAVLASAPAWMMQQLERDHPGDGVAALLAREFDDIQCIARVRGDERQAATWLQRAADWTPAPTVQLQGTTSLRMHAPMRALAADVDTSALPDAWEALLPEAVLVAGSTAALSDDIAASKISPQGIASMVTAHVVGAQPGERIADLCAAPGGKTMHLAEHVHPNGHVAACELHARRATAMQRRVAASAYADTVEVITGDASDPHSTPQLTAQLFDRVLVDAPCSGLGVADGRPDLRWHTTPDSIASLNHTQHALLARAASIVQPGGRVVYSTCTLTRSECEDIVAQAISSGILEPDPLDAAVAALPEVVVSAHELRTWPHIHGIDGFYIASLRRPIERPAT
jgi:16S rRNA (cytosine967-C5)-methyltransferase